ncbi:MAG: polyprenyl synthetase family protein [Bacteroidales bacterium]|nr:polyprenyl synthetase family protein [Bacteroidales bacterium]
MNEEYRHIIAPIIAEFEEFKSLFNDCFQSSQPILIQALQHIHQRNGKLLRPALSLLFAKAFGAVNQSTLHAAVSLELLHTSSLVHDDVVDESDTRRGQESVNSLFNNQIAVLVGDYLLALSLTHSAATNNVSMVHAISMLGQLLAEGELEQIADAQLDDFSYELYYSVIRKKTASLFSTAALMGALSADASSEQLECARSFGESVGMIFQIKDDIFDYYTDLNIGKPTGSDMKEGKITLPALYLINQYPEYESFARRVRSLDVSLSDIGDFIEKVKEGGGVDYAIQMMNELRNQAISMLPDDIPSDIRDSLIAYVDFVIERVK